MLERKMMRQLEMGSPRLLFFIFPTLIQLLVLTIAQPIPPLSFFCNNEGGNFTNNSTYKSNLHHVLTSFSSNTKINYGFYSDSFGQKIDKVNAIALCRGDKTPDTCRSCIRNSSQVLAQLCPNQKEAITWYDDCMLRYSNRSIFGNMELYPELRMMNIKNVSQVTQFNQTLNTLLDSLTSQAASGDSMRKFATGNATTKTSNQTIYALAQCTPDLSKQNCSDCLTEVIGILPQCCAGKQGARVIAPSCHFRYEIELFYDSMAKTLPSSPAPAPAQLPSSPAPAQLPSSPAPSPAILPPSPVLLPSSPAPSPALLPPSPALLPSPPPPLLPDLPLPPLAPPPPTGTASSTGKASKIAAGALIANVFLVLL